MALHRLPTPGPAGHITPCDACWHGFHQEMEKTKELLLCEAMEDNLWAAEQIARFDQGFVFKSIMLTCCALHHAAKLKLSLDTRTNSQPAFAFDVELWQPKTVTVARGPNNAQRNLLMSASVECF
ncbi:unnamed protein product [Polarella glacialis]|uniref:Uncharacterized protein n=1 Tax=Polarella glacialis TaxID=89957 RepID=A0A813HIC9_POLGL|nr:unnamed protein product [Polarella glacialis]